MNRTKLKSYAPQALKDFIQAMTDRAAYYGITSTKIEPIVETRDIAVIAVREHPKAVARKRKQLEERIKRIGTDWTKSFNQLMEAMAYTWFNRFVAIRFMALHGYLERSYLHRYNEGTLARMRTEYVIPLQGQIAARIDQLEGDKIKATSTSHGKKLQKEQDELKKKQAELLAFEEKLKNAADQKISLDLDNGVKVNYAKFGDLLAESKSITGGKDDE